MEGNKRAELTNLRDESINTEGMILSYDLIKVSVGGYRIPPQLLVSILPELKGLQPEMFAMLVRTSRMRE